MGDYYRGQYVWLRAAFQDERTGGAFDPPVVELHVLPDDGATPPSVLVYGASPAIVRVVAGTYEARFVARYSAKYYWKVVGDGLGDAASTTYSGPPVGHIRVQDLPF